MSISNFNPHGCSLGFYQSPANKKKHTVPNCEDSYDDCILKKIYFEIKQLHEYVYEVYIINDYMLHILVHVYHRIIYPCTRIYHYDIIFIVTKFEI